MAAERAASRFLDTNILVYALSSGDARASLAERLLEEGGVINVQVLNELTHVARRKLGWSWGEIRAALPEIAVLTGPPLPLTAAVHAGAVDIAATSGLSFHDALIVAAAADAGCTELLTEDLQHGQRIAGITVRNPFRTS